MAYGSPGIVSTQPTTTKNKTMKLLLTEFYAAMITSPLAFAEGKCEKKCDKECKEKEESTLVAGKDCDKKKCVKDKEESTLLAGKDCDKKKCDKNKEHETRTKGMTARTVRAISGLSFP